MAERVMLALGPFRFEMGQATYQSLAMSQSWRWPAQARIGREPALQFTGREPAEIRLQGVLFPGFDAGLAQVDEMRALADQGKPLQLVDGLGRVWGSWVIVEVGDTRSVLMDDGQPRRVGFELKLQAYGEDETVTDYSGGWSPFAILMTDLTDFVDDLSNDPVSAIIGLIGDIADIGSLMGGGSDDDDSSGSNTNALTAISSALGSLITSTDTFVRGLHSEWLQAVPDTHDPARQALDAWLTAMTAISTAQTTLPSTVVSLGLRVVRFLDEVQALQTVLKPLANGSAATSAAVYDLAQRTLLALDAAQQAGLALQEKLS